MTLTDLAQTFALKLLDKSGVKEWADPDSRLAIATAALDLADLILEGSVAVTAVFREQFGTSKTFGPSGASGAMSPSTLANGAYWQSAKIDFGATVGQAYAVYLNAELAATPTAGNSITLWANPSSSATAATDNRGGCSGSDASYTGYSSNAAASVAQLPLIGAGVTTTQATATVQKMFVGYYVPAQRYASLVMLNGAGSAFASDTNFLITLVPVEPTSEPS